MRSRHVLAVSALALTLAVGACSNKDDSSTNLATQDPKAAMAAASKRSAEAKTVRLSLSATSSTNVKVLDGRGSYDFVNERGRFTLKTTLGSGADMLITPTDVYVKVAQKEKPTDPSWIRLTEADLAKASETSGAQFVAEIRRQVDPRSSLEALGSEVSGLNVVGSTKVRGVDTTHLRGRVDLSDAAIAKAPASKQEDLRQKRTLFGADGYPLDVFLDGDGRVRRVQYELPSADTATKTSTVVRFDLYDFGRAAKIQLPAASDVRDASTVTTTPAPGK